MSRQAYAVFSEGIIARMKIKNRLVRSATYEAAMTEDGRTTDKILMLYKDLSEGGVGMIITGHMAVLPQGKGQARQTPINADTFIPEIARIADTVHRYGNSCKIVAQLSHSGRQVLQWAVKHEHVSAQAVGPSAVPSPILRMQARALSLEEIQQVIQAFVDAIVRVQQAGYDGAQLHAAHGYLLSSFLSPYTNRRTDPYGGSSPNRVRIIREIITRARRQVGDFPILIKINCDDHVEGGISPDSFPELAGEIERAGVDAIEVSGGMWDCLVRSEEELGFIPVPIPEARTYINTPERQSYFLNYVKNLKLSVPILLVGGNRNIEHMENILHEGHVSFFSLCRPLINEPGLPQRWLEGQGKETAHCVSCNGCMTTIAKGPVSCLLKKSKLQQALLKSAARGWKMFFK